MYCKSCGKQIDDDSKFCSFCGTKQTLTFKPTEIFINQGEERGNIKNTDLQCNKQQIIDLFVAHPDFFIRQVSQFYPLNEIQLEKYSLNWYLISRNTRIAWSEELISNWEGWDWQNLRDNKAIPEKLISLFDEFENTKTEVKYSESWFSKNISELMDLSRISNVPWSLELIQKYKTEWNWKALSFNPSLPWSLELIEEFKEKWDWESLSLNWGISWSEELINKYSDKWDWERISKADFSTELSELFIEKYINKWDWKLLSQNKSLPLSISFIEKYRNYIDWKGLSSNPSPKWSIQIIEKYKDHLDWKMLSLNIPIWNEVFIEKFINLISLTALTWNRHIKWTEHLIEKYIDNWDYSAFNCDNYHGDIPWSIKLIREFEDVLDWEFFGSTEISGWISQTSDVWDKAFKLYVDDNLIEEVFNKINERES